MASSLRRMFTTGQDALFWNDSVFWLGGETQASDNVLVQQFNGRERRYTLIAGPPIRDLEESDRLRRREEIAHAKGLYVQQQLDIESRDALEFANQYKLLRFVVDELFPRMVAVPLEERIDAALHGGHVKSSKEILEAGLGDSVSTSRRTLMLKTYTLEKIERDIARERRSILGGADTAMDPAVNAITQPSLFSQSHPLNPLLLFAGTPYACCTQPSNADGLSVVIDGARLSVHRTPLDYGTILETYEQLRGLQIKEDALKELRERADTLQAIIVKDHEYMPLMDLDEFRFQDIGFFRNGHNYFVFRRIPKFARQTTYDMDLFAAKECDEEGFAGDLGIGLSICNGTIAYINPNQVLAGVVYRGPIKQDAPFHHTVEIADPNMRRKYGSLRTICHISGYPSFPVSPDGFMQFLTYATNNFLDSFRQEFRDRHYDDEEQARLLDAGKLLRKARAKELGYLLTNIHETPTRNAAT
jgi:hypothetical protein